MRIKDLITSRVCSNTVFENSWIWYCDECRKHGTATSADEAEYLAKAHLLYFSYEALDDSIDFDFDSDDEEILSYMECAVEDRDNHEWENDLCAIYIIDEGSNITYDLYDDYGDKTPNQVADLETMIKLQKQLGLE